MFLNLAIKLSCSWAICWPVPFSVV